MSRVPNLSKELAALEARLEAKLGKSNARAMLEMNRELTRLGQESTNNLKREVNELKDSLGFMNITFEELKSKCETLLNDSLALRKENERLRRCHAEVSKGLAQLEQYSRANNVEIRGVPVTNNEDCTHIVRTIADKIGYKVYSADLEMCHRVPVANSATRKSIIARFVCKSKRNEFVSKARKARLTVLGLGFRFHQQGVIFFNDHLCPEYKKLFSAALKLKKERCWKFLWTDEGTIKARKSENSVVYKITCSSDLSIFK